MALACFVAPAQASFINYSSREINVKVVYYGSETAGLHENLLYIYNKTRPEAKGKMIELATENEKTVFFDFLPLSLGEIRGFKTRFHLYTVPGHVQYNASRLLILKGVDGIVFVVDARASAASSTRASWDGLKENLAKNGYDRDEMPIVIQIDHLHSKFSLQWIAQPLRDHWRELSMVAKPGDSIARTKQTLVFVAVDLVARMVLERSMSQAEVKTLLGLTDEPIFVANSGSGHGVFDALKASAKQVLTELRGEPVKAP